MARIQLQSIYQPETTQLSNLFIDHYMARANGEFVKVYIYLLRCLSSPTAELGTAKIADQLLCTEGDVLRALKYWEDQHLLSLQFEEGQLSSIAFCDPRSPGPENITPITAVRSTFLTPERIQELKENEEVGSLLYVAEQYMGRPLNSSETRKILFFYDELNMSADLIDYLIEYCVSHGHGSIHYMDSVAQSWVKEGINTVELARQSTSRYRKEYFTILRAMGISGRNPVSAETRMIDKWMESYGLGMEVILEACRRTVLQTGQGSFPYTDRILSDWHSQQVHNLSDIVALDQEHKKKTPVKPEKTTPTRTQHVRSNTNRFNNFQQRDYNFDEYEKKLLAKSSAGN